MSKHLHLLLSAAIIGSSFSSLSSLAQNTSPYWSLAGNSNATSSTHKLGTTNAYPLRITTNNTTRIYISSNAGYVGVGTTAPSSRLHVNAAAATSPLKFQINGATKLYMSSAGGLSVGSGSAAPANGLYVAGNAGIGTATPASGYKLHVAGKGRFTTGLVVNDGGLKVINQAEDSTAIYASAPNGYGAYGVYASAMLGVYGTGMAGVVGEGYTGVAGRGVTGVEGDNDEEDGGNGLAGYSNLGNGVYGTTNTSSSYAGYFEGNVFSTGTYTGSDRTLKQNIADVTSAMAVLNKLQPKSYTFRQDGNYKLMHLPEGTHYGLIAQDVEQVLPNLVKATTFQTRNTKPFVKPTAGVKPVAQTSESIKFKALNYNELIPLVIKGLQELDTKTQRIDELERQLAELRSIVLELKNGHTNSVSSMSAYLEQNTPNPAGGTTTIRYHLPAVAASASLVLTNAKGQTIKTMRLSNTGTSQVSVNTTLLAAGTYNYTLWVDGKSVDSRRLIVVR